MWARTARVAGQVWMTPQVPPPGCMMRAGASRTRRKILRALQPSSPNGITMPLTCSCGWNTRMQKNSRMHITTLACWIRWPTIRDKSTLQTHNMTKPGASPAWITARAWFARRSIIMRGPQQTRAVCWILQRRPDSPTKRRYRVLYTPMMKTPTSRPSLTTRPDRKHKHLVMIRWTVSPVRRLPVARTGCIMSLTPTTLQQATWPARQVWTIPTMQTMLMQWLRFPMGTIINTMRTVIWLIAM